MAIEINEFRLPMSAVEARDYIKYQTDNFGVFFDLDRIYEVIAIRRLEMRDCAMLAIALTKDVQFNMRNKDQVIKQLIAYGVPWRAFVAPGSKTNELALNDPIEMAILNNASTPPEAVALLEIYRKWKNANNMCNKLVKMTGYSECVGLSYNNRRMVVVHPEWSILSTSRIQADSPNVQQIDRNLPDILTSPAHYTLWRADSAQIEPCINFSTFLRDELIFRLIITYGDAYFGLWRYCMMDPVEEALLREDFDSNYKHIEVTDHIKEQRQNIKRLTNAGSYGSGNLGNINPELARKYEERIVRHPARLALEAKITNDVRHGADTFYGLFGTPVKPEKTQKYQPGEPGWQDHVIRCGINNPVQTTASELMLHSVNRARQILNKHPKSHICFYKHDEAVFYLHEDDVADGIMDELEGITAYNVKGWIPIKSDSFVGVKDPVYPTFLAS